MIAAKGDHDEEVYEEDKEKMHCFVDSDSQVLKFREQYSLPKSEYGKIFDSMKLPEVKKHVTTEQSMDILQFIGKKLDPTKKEMPSVQESRHFMYLQELLLLLGDKEKMKNKNYAKGTKRENSKKKVKERKQQKVLSASEDNAESSEEEGDKKPKATKSPVARKYRFYVYHIYHLFVKFISVFLICCFSSTC